MALIRMTGGRGSGEGRAAIDRESALAKIIEGFFL